MTTLTVQDRAREILNSLPATSFVFRLDTQGRYLEVRTPPDPARLWRSPSDHIGKTLEDVLPGEMAAPRRFYFEQAIATLSPQLYGYPHPITSGRWMACQIVPIVDNGEVVELVMEVYDIAPFSRLNGIYIQK